MLIHDRLKIAPLGVDFFAEPVFPVKDDLYDLLSLKDERGFPSSIAAKYMDKNTPLDIKTSLEPLLQSANVRGLPDDDSAFASIIPRGLTENQIESLIQNDSEDELPNDLEDNG